MKRIRGRASIALVLAGLIVLGLGFFLWRLWDRGGEWASYRANAHIYQSGALKNAVLTDRNGVELLRARDGSYTYAADETLRLSTLHALGDHRGYLGGGALRLLADEIAGYSFVFGTPEEANTLALSLDSRLQTTAWNGLAGRPGAVLVTNYETGEVLCMVSSPSYDPALGPDLSVDGVLINRCTGAAYVPGSIFKLVTLTAACENLPDLRDRTFECKKALKVGAGTVTCNGKHGKQTIEQALANSCNIAFGQLAMELGGETIQTTAERLGVAGSLRYCGALTAAGRCDAPAPGTADEAWTGIGQHTDLVTPYAMARLCAAIANGGAAPEPVLLAGAQGEPARLMDSDTAEFVGDCMSYDVVYKYGTGSFPGLDLCAKSGTAEVGDGTTHAWFVGYLRSGPPLAFAVVLEHGGGGLLRASPLANLVLQKAVEIYE